MSDIYICTADDMHPYNCFPDKCIHCNLVRSASHIPEQCWLCCDGDPEENKPKDFGLKDIPPYKAQLAPKKEGKNV